MITRETNLDSNNQSSQSGAATDYHYYIDPMHLSQKDSEWLLYLISNVDINKKLLVTGDKIQIANVIYHLVLRFPILIIRNDKKIITHLEVIEYINSNWYYQNEINSFNQNLDFSFLTITKYHGKLYINKNGLYYEAHPILGLDFYCSDIIDPRAASLPQRIFLDDVFKLIFQTIEKDQISNVNFISKGFLKAGFHMLEFRTSLSKVLIRMELKTAVALRESSHYRYEYRADVLDSKLGTGVFAHVWSLAGIFKNASFSDQPKRVLKDYVIAKNTKNKKSPKTQQIYIDPASALKGFIIGGLADHLNTSQPTGVLIDNEAHWQVREKKLPGIELFDFLCQFSLYADTAPPQSDEISIDDFLELIYEATLAVQYYHFKGIVHRDIKPENINVDYKNHMRCYVFDVNLSKFIAEDDAKISLGSLPYISPEKRKGLRSNFKCDVFSLMRSFVFIFGDEQPSPNQADSPSAYQPKYPLLSILSTLNLLSIEHASRIRSLFDQSFEFDPQKRCDIDFILTEIDMIMWERRKENMEKTFSKDLFNNYCLARDLGLSVRDMFVFYKKYTDYVFKEDRYATFQVGDVTISTLLNIKKKILEKLEQLTEDPMVLSEFSRSSGIRAIRDLASSVEIKNEISNIISNYVNWVSKFNKLHSETSNTATRTSIKTILDLRKKYFFNLDNIKVLVEIFQNRFQKLSVNSQEKRRGENLLKFSRLFSKTALQIQPNANPAPNALQSSAIKRP